MITKAPETKKTVGVVIASPQELQPERNVMEEVIKELNSTLADTYGLVLELVRCEDLAYACHHEDGPQGVIDRILKIHERAVLLGMFWQHFGSPTKGVLSGTEHEIRTAIKSKELLGRPHQIMIYFKEVDSAALSEKEREQYELVLQFRNSLPKTVWHKQFKDTPGFEKLARRELANYIKDNYPLPGKTASGEQSHIREYCKKMRERFSTISLFGHKPSSAGEGDAAPEGMRSIERGYLPVYLTEWSGDSGASDGRPVQLEELCEDILSGKGALRLLIRGRSGGGKTTMLRCLGHRLATEALEKNQEIIPIYVRLQRFCCSKNVKAKDLKQFVLLQVDRDSDPQDKEMTDALTGRSRFLRKSTVLLLDGIDEIEDLATAGYISTLLAKFSDEYPHCNVIVTSRYMESLQPGAYIGYKTMDLKPLSPELIDDYISRWFVRKPELIDRLREIMEKKPRIRELAVNPFLLSMICYTFHRGGKTEIIERRSQLYETCTQYLLERQYHPADEACLHLKSEKERIKYREQTIALLKDLSLRFFLWDEADFADEYVNVIGGNNPTAKALGETAAVLADLERRTGLLQRTEKGYTFIHRSLWEYFAALALLGRKPEFIIRRAGNPDWEEVVRLYAGLLTADEEIETLVKGLWATNPPLALRVTSEVKTSVANLIRSLVAREEGNRGSILLIETLENSLRSVSEDEGLRIVEETLQILLVTCNERDCEVIYHAELLLEKAGLKPLEVGGLIYRHLGLEGALAREQELREDPENLLHWITVEGGTFQMGDDRHETDEATAHPVKIQTFEMTKHPVTNRLLSQFPFVSKNPGYGRDNHPAVGNNWYEARYFALWIGARLPSEAEWEYAARGGQNSLPGQYWFGDSEDELAHHAWFGDAGRRKAHAVDDVNERTGDENLNPIGLSNILGNIWEWVEDNFHTSYEGAPEDGTAWVANPHGLRVIRGGGWYDSPAALRCASRLRSVPGLRDTDLGFRLARTCC